MLYQKIGDKLNLVDYYNLLFVNKIIYQQLSLKDKLKKYDFFIITDSLSKYLNIIKYIVNNSNNIYLEIDQEIIYLYNQEKNVNIKISNNNYQYYYVKQFIKLSFSIIKLRVLEKYIEKYDVLYLYKPIGYQKICLCVRNRFGKNKYINLKL